MSTKFRSEYGAFTPEAMAMYNEMQDFFVPFSKKWLEKFSQDEILSMVVSQTSLILSEDSLVKAIYKMKAEKEKKKDIPPTN